MQKFALLAAVLMNYIHQPARPHEDLAFTTHVELHGYHSEAPQKMVPRSATSELNLSSLFGDLNDTNTTSEIVSDGIYIPEPRNFWSYVDDFESYDYMSTIIGRDDWFYHWLTYRFDTAYTRTLTIGPSLWSTYPITLSGPGRDYQSVLICMKVQLK